MLVIIASSWDLTAKALASRLNVTDAHIVTPLDLSRPGWRWRLGERTGNSAATQRETLEVGQISGVLTRLPYVHEREVPHIVGHDRDYVAAEMQAFLFAWISGLSCPVLNRPAPFSLCGPAWRHEQWVCAAARQGLRVCPARVVASLGSIACAPTMASECSSVTIVGQEHLGRLDPFLIAQARRLASAAGVELIKVIFSSARADAYFVGATAWPDLLDDETCDLVARYFQPRTAR